MFGAEYFDIHCILRHEKKKHYFEIILHTNIISKEEPFQMCQSEVVQSALSISMPCPRSFDVQ